MRFVSMFVFTALVLGLVGCGRSTEPPGESLELRLMKDEPKAEDFEAARDLTVVECQEVKGTKLKRVIFRRGNEEMLFAAFASQGYEKGVQVKVVAIRTQSTMGRPHMYNFVVKE